jgi:hypothetical protein
VIRDQIPPKTPSHGGGITPNNWSEITPDQGCPKQSSILCCAASPQDWGTNSARKAPPPQSAGS